MRAKLTAASIQGVTVPDGKLEEIVWDTELTGFGLRLRKGGSRSWVLLLPKWLGGTKMALGPATQESFKTAKGPGGVVLKLGIREQVAQLIARVHLGQDPRTDKLEAQKKAAETFRGVSPKFLEHKRRVLRPSSFRQVNRHITIHARGLEGHGLASITRRQLSDLFDGVMEKNGMVTANRVHNTLAEFFGWAMGKGYIDTNPMIGVPKFEGEKQRERVLDSRELKLIWDACAPTDHYGAIVRLLVLTGQREAEIGSLCWSEIAGDTITLPPERTKNKRKHVLPLTSPALAILDAQPRRANNDGTPRDLVFGVADGAPFGGWSRCKKRLDERIAAENGRPLAPWRVHDIRRSVSTGMGKLGVLPHVKECVLNHVSGFRAGVGGVYDRHDYLPEMRRALDLWADHVMALVEGRESNVAPLRRPA
jgi:integrase